MFAVMPHSEAVPQEIDGVIECWLKPQGRSRFQDAAHCDFWRADAKGRMFLMRGYQEDSQDTISPGTIFDTTLPIWRLGEALLHASRLARLLGQDESTIAVRMRVLFTGLTGRVLRAWGNPLSGDFLVGSHPSRSDEATSDLVVAARDIDRHLGRHVQALAAPLFERFGIAGLSQDGISAELARMQQNVR